MAEDRTVSWILFFEDYQGDWRLFAKGLLKISLIFLSCDKILYNSCQFDFLWKVPRALFRERKILAILI